MIAVSSTDCRLIPLTERTDGKLGDLFWHMPGGTAAEPLVHDASTTPVSGHGSSLATALFTGVLARLLAREGSNMPGATGRQTTLRLADEHTRHWSTVDLDGRAQPESRRPLESHE